MSVPLFLWIFSPGTAAIATQRAMLARVKEVQRFVAHFMHQCPVIKGTS